MVWRNFFNKTPEGQDERREAEPSRAPVSTSTGRAVPPHLAQAIANRRQDGPDRAELSPAQRKLNGLRRQRMAILYDIEQGELAASPENPWTSRIGLLTEAMETVTSDIAATSEVKPGPYSPLPATPITIGEIATGDAAAVGFSVGDVRFAYSEDQDWAERGHQITRSELVQRTGDVAPLIPGDTPADLRDRLAEHLADSLFVFASDLRDRALDGEPMPGQPTLADLAAPCPICGGWTDWRGTCQNCARRQAAVMALKREEGRLLDERSSEAEERHRLVEGLPLAHRRLRDVEADLARLGETPD